MESVKALIDAASRKCGGDAELAREIGVGKAMVSLMRSGKRHVPVELAVLMAPLAGIKWEDAARLALLDHCDPERAARLERVFFSRSLGGVVGMLLACAVALGPDTAMASQNVTNCSYTYAHSGKLPKWITRVVAWLRRLSPGSAAPGRSTRPARHMRQLQAAH